MAVRPRGFPGPLEALRRADHGTAEVARRAVGRHRAVNRAMLATARHAAAAEILLFVLLAIGGGSNARARRMAALRIALALPIVLAAVAVVGGAARRSRPFARSDVAPLVEHAPGRSFPSRHTACAAAMATVALPASRIMGASMAALAVALGVSRVYVGLHFPSDVLAGAAIGTAIGLLARGRPSPSSGRTAKN